MLSMAIYIPESKGIITILCACANRLCWLLRDDIYVHTGSRVRTIQVCRFGGPEHALDVYPAPGVRAVGFDRVNVDVGTVAGAVALQGNGAEG